MGKVTFKVGDKVVLKKTYDLNSPDEGSIGIIGGIFGSYASVEFEDFDRGHSGDMGCCKYPHGWNVPLEGYLEPYLKPTVIDGVEYV